jgi:hypothetical protein
VVRPLVAVIGIAVLAVLNRPAPGLAGEGEDLANMHAGIGKQSAPGIPSGPYSGWSDEDKKSAFRTLALPCAWFCGDMYDSLRRPEAQKERTLAEMQICSHQCIAWHLPPDHPMIPKLQETLQRYYEEAHRLGSPLPPPTATQN